MNTVDPTRLLDVALEASRAAGRHALDNFSRREETLSVTTHDVKLALDVECQRVAETILRKAFPDHAMLGEEQGLREEGEYRWVIDPIDGTVNFSHGVPYWSNSIAVQHRGRSVAGVISLPMLGEEYWATLDGEAARNGMPIHVSDVADLSNSLIYSGMVENEGDNGVSLRVTARLAGEVRKIRILGSAAAQLCYVACGRGDGYVETSIHLWDIAAGALIVERAGGACESVEDLGNYAMRFVASNGRIHSEFRSVVMEGIG